MGGQMTSSDLEHSRRRRKTMRGEFLAGMDEVIPWDERCAFIEPHCYEGKRGRKPIGIGRMPRMYFLQRWFNLSDEGVEDAVADSYAMRSFMGADFSAGGQVPDSTTLLKFRRILEKSGFGGAMPASINEVSTAANAHDATQASKPIRKDGIFVYGDSGRLGIGERDGVKDDSRLSGIEGARPSAPLR